MYLELSLDLSLHLKLPNDLYWKLKDLLVSLLLGMIWEGCFVLKRDWTNFH